MAGFLKKVQHFVESIVYRKRKRFALFWIGVFVNASFIILMSVCYFCNRIIQLPSNDFRLHFLHKVWHFLQKLLYFFKESPPFFRMAGFIGISKKRSAFYRKHKFLESVEHNMHMDIIQALATKVFLIYIVLYEKSICRQVPKGLL